MIPVEGLLLTSHPLVLAVDKYYVRVRTGYRVPVQQQYELDCHKDARKAVTKRMRKRRGYTRIGDTVG